MQTLFVGREKKGERLFTAVETVYIEACVLFTVDYFYISKN